jgi:hypothetical protein
VIEGRASVLSPGSRRDPEANYGSVPGTDRHKPRRRDRASSASALRRKLAIVSRLAKCIVLGQRDFSSCRLADG